MPATGGASGVQLVGVCWSRGRSRRDHTAADCIEQTESTPAEHINAEQQWHV